MRFDFFKSRPINGTVLYNMKEDVKKLLSKYMEYGIYLSMLAERAHQIEDLDTTTYIQNNYKPGKDLLSAEKLLHDLNYMEFSRIKNINIENAVIEANKGFQIAKISNYPAEKKDAAELLSTIHQHFTNYKAAFDYQAIAKNIGDSIFYDENKNIALKSEFKYETEKKDNQLKQLSQAKKITELQNQRQKITLLLLIFGIVSASISAFLLFNRYKTNKQNELLKSIIEKSEAEKKLPKANSKH